MKIIGIDPGVRPAIAELTIFDDPYIEPEVNFWPRETLTQSVKIMGAGRIKLENGPALKVIREMMWEAQPDMVVLEHVTPMKTWGLSTQSKLLGAYHSMRGLVVGCDMKLTLVSPHQWQKHFGLAGRKTPDDSVTNKERNRHFCLDMYPDQFKELQRKKDHDKADALLMATWYLQTGGNDND